MIHIDRQRCNGCKHRDDGPRCKDICPGDLYYLDNEQRPQMHDPSECWDCCACVKACPCRALSIELPFQINEHLTRLYAHHKGNYTVWRITDPDNTRIRERQILSLNKQGT